jgi:hypothetical protein
MMGRRWDAWFSQGNLVVRRRRFVPWPRVDVRWIPLTAVVDIRSQSPTEWAWRRGQVTVQNQSAPHTVEVYQVQFAPEPWQRASALMRDWPTAPPPPAVNPSRPGIVVAPRPVPPTLPAITVPQNVPRERDRSAEPAAMAPTSAPAVEARSTTPVVHASDGKRRVWLWTENGKIHGSLAPVGTVAAHQLDPAEIARLLLADPSKAMPAIRTLTGIDDDWQALACIRTWRRLRRVVDLSASDFAGRQHPQAPQRPAGMAADGSVRTVSGGLPSLGKRHR